jgi:Lipoate synthase
VFDRDDLRDYGAEFWAETIRYVKKKNPGITLETLIPDFLGKAELIHKVIDAGPEIISHNMETVRRLTPLVRSRAKYHISLKTMETVAKSNKSKPKSGMMVGLGETPEEVVQTMDDLRVVGCKVLTIGQYLQRTRKHLPVSEFISPDQFKEYKRIGLEKGFEFVESGPLVRSSYRAERHV